MKNLIFIGVGIVAGISSGLFGVGGGTIIVPALIFLVGVSQVTATGTSLVALLLPVGIFGVLEYYKMGKITREHIVYGLMIAIGMFLGVYLGARIAVGLSEHVMKRLFSAFLMMIALKLWFH